MKGRLPRMRTATVVLMRASQGEYRFEKMALGELASQMVGQRITNIRFDQMVTVKRAWVDEDRTGNPRIRAEVEFKI